MRDLSSPLAPTYGEPKKKKPTKGGQARMQNNTTRDSIRAMEAQRAKEIRAAKADASRKKRSNDMAKREKAQEMKEKAAAKKKAAAHKKKIATIKRPIHSKAMSDKKTSTMHKTRNPKPGPYQY
jgi:hypothetical protein